MTVDVVIPTTGRDSLRRALLSLRRQTEPAAQVIVVLDRPEERDRVASMLDGETLVVTSGGVGGGAARLAGVDSGRAEFVAFLDDDDWWEPSKIEKQLAAMRTSAARWSLSGAYFHAGDQVRLVPTESWTPEKAISDYTLERTSLRYGRTFVQSSTLVVARDLLEDVPWDPALPRHQDWDLVLRLAKTSSALVFLEEPLAHVEQGSSGSISKASRWRESAIWIAKQEAGGRAKADFVSSVVLRGALRARDVAGVSWSLRQFWALRSAPHFPALAVGISGLLKGKGS